MRQLSFDNLPLEWIRAFEVAARCGSFTGAAAETGLTQSAISQRIANLEQRLGARLFVRRARRIDLSVEGEAWLPHVQAALENLRESSETLFGITRDHLTLSASTSITELWIAPRLRGLAARTGAQISIRTMVVSSDTSSDDDTIRIRYGSGDWSQAYKAPLYEECLSPVAAPALLTCSPSWQSLPRIAVSGPRPGWSEWAERTGSPSTPVPTLRFDTFSSALAAATAGNGVLLASLPLCRKELASGSLERVSDDMIGHHQTYWLLASRKRVTRGLWEKLHECLVDGAEPGHDY